MMNAMSIANPLPNRKKLNFAILTVAAVLCATSTFAAEPTGEAQATPNRAPLVSTPFIPLPLGAVRAKGWLAGQLRRQADGLTGHAEELMPDIGGNSGWLGGTGESWERGPYYVKGLVALAYVMHDPDLIAKAKKWVDWTLDHQRPDGQIGPASNDDWWPRMVITWALRDYYEATQDARVLTVLTKYANYIEGHLPQRPLKEWAKARAVDQIDTLFWLYNRTGDPSVLRAADVLQGQSNHWDNFFATLRETPGDFYSSHNVNVTQAMKFPAVVYEKTGVPAERQKFLLAWDKLQRRHGLPTGLWSGTEFLATKATFQGTEMCSIVEQMLSSEIAVGVTANPTIGDDLERITFNLLAGGTTKDFHQLQYYTLVNQPVAHVGPNGYQQDYNNGIVPGPMSGYPCCCFNLHMGWPKYVQHSWMASADGGLAAVAYGPTEVTTLVNQTPVIITEETDYPFADTIKFKLNPQHPLEFSLKLRIPGWAVAPRVSINGVTVADPIKPGSFLSLSRTWKAGDIVDAEFPAELTTVDAVNGSAALWRGPLAFSLGVAEKATPTHLGAPGFEELAMDPLTPWNYALDLDRARPKAFATLIRGHMPANPWLPQTAPIRLRVHARRLPQWGLTPSGRLANEVPPSPVQSDEPLEEVTLVPFGAQTLRITAFPLLRGGAILEPGITASYQNPSDATDAILDNPPPKDSADHAIPRFTWWDHKGTSEWIQWTFNEPTRLNKLSVYWFDDSAGCALPASWTLYYLNGDRWTPVANPDSFVIERDRPGTVNFTPVTTQGVRIEVKLRPGKSAGILLLKR